MADLTDLQAAQTIKIAGSDSTGVEDNFVNATSNGGLHTNLRNDSGTEIGTSLTPLRTDPTGTTTQPVSDAGGSLTVDNAGTFAVQAAQSGTWNINNVSGTISLPTGASTLVEQQTQTIALQLLDDVPAAMNAAFSKGAPSMGQLDDVGTTVATENNVAPVRITEQRAFHTNLRNSSGTEITSSNTSVPGNQILHTQAPDNFTASTALGALSATVSLSIAGLTSVGFQLAAGTLIGTLIAESSLDGGTTWVTSGMVDSASPTIVTSLVFTSSNTLKVLSIIPVNGASNVRIRVSAYTSGTANGILRATTTRGVSQSISSIQIVSSLPAASITSDLFINTGVTMYTSYTAAQNLALKQFYAGGTGIGKQALFQYAPSTTQFVNAGDFETPADINTTWVWISGGAGSIASSTAQFFTGARSVALTFTNSSGGNAQGVKQTFSAVQNLSTWRYVTAEFYNVVSVGGAYTRTISIILTDSGGSTVKYDLSGLSTSSPFNASGWIKLTGELLNPTSFTGTGFDYTQVVSIELRMTDSANKAGTVYWDTVQLEAQLTPIIPIFHAANTSLNVVIDPVVVLNSGSQIVMQQTNLDATRKEFFSLVSGVAL